MANLVPGQIGEIHGSAGGTFTFPGTVAANDRIIVGIYCHNTTPTAPTASGVTFFQNGATQTDAGGSTYTAWSGVPSAAFSGAITINGTSTQFFTAQFAEITNNDPATGSTTAGVDVSAGSTGNSTTPSSGATAATGADGEYLFSFFGQDGNTTSITATGNVATKENTANASTPVAYGSGWGDNTNIASGSTPTGSWTTNVTARWGCITVVYKVAAGATGTVSPPEVRVPRGNPLWLARERPYLSGQRVAFPAPPPQAPLDPAPIWQQRAGWRPRAARRARQAPTPAQLLAGTEPPPARPRSRPRPPARGRAASSGNRPAEAAASQPPATPARRRSPAWGSRRRYQQPILPQAAVPPFQFVLLGWARARRAVSALRRRPSPTPPIPAEPQPQPPAPARRRTVAWLRRRAQALAPFAVAAAPVAPAFVEWWRNRRVLRALTRRARRFEPTPAQQQAAQPPPFVEWWRSRRVARALARRARASSPPAAAEAPPARPARRRLAAWVRRRAGTAFAPPAAAPMVQQPAARRRRPLPRRARAWAVPLPQASAVAKVATEYLLAVVARAPLALARARVRLAVVGRGTTGVARRTVQAVRRATQLRRRP